MLKRLEDRTFVLIVAAPSMGEAHKIAVGAGIQFPNGHIRHVRNAHGLRGWSWGTPVLTGERGHWPAEFEECLTALIARGQLRIAQDSDLQRARGEQNV